MNNFRKAIEKISKSGKGLWGIECPEGTKFDPNVIRDFNDTGYVLEFLRVAKGKIDCHFISDEGPVDTCNTLEFFARRGKEAATQDGCSKVQIIITDIHVVTAEEQYKILSDARRIQEEERDFRFQFIVCGRWSHYLIKEYHDQNCSALSPPTESKNAIQLSYASEENILDELNSRGVLGTAPNFLDRVGCTFLIEQTGGDWFLIQQVIERIDTSPWTDSIEQHIKELESSPEVCDEVARRIAIICDSSKTELDQLLKTHRLLRPMGKKASEELWLAGLARKIRRTGGGVVLEIASPVVDAVVRKILGSSNKKIARASEICYKRNSVAVEAYRRVAEIENLLRNIIVSEWRCQCEDKWVDKLAGNKTPAREYKEDDEVEIVRLFREPLRQVGFELTRIKKIDGDSKDTSSESVPKRKMDTLLDAANDWQRRQQKNHAIRLQNDNVMHFLTTESLKGILVDKKNGFYGDGRDKRMFKKEELYSALDEYVAIRAAVAHNQPLKLSMITKLDDLTERFLNWLTVYADQSDS